MLHDKEGETAGWLTMSLAVTFITTSDSLADSQYCWLFHLSQHLAG
jgi:hypothetical protein